MRKTKYQLHPNKHNCIMKYRRDSCVIYECVVNWCNVIILQNIALQYNTIAVIAGILPPELKSHKVLVLQYFFSFIYEDAVIYFFLLKLNKMYEPLP